MIKAYCRTNWDDAKRWTWPTAFVELPRIGDRVAARESGQYSVMKVVGITHRMQQIHRDVSELHPENWEPVVEIELGRVQEGL